MMASTPPSSSIRALSLTCALFIGMGLLVAFAGHTALFSAWRDAAATALFGQPRLAAELAPLVRLSNGILGGSIVGKWVAAAWLVGHPLARGQRWAWHALVIGLLSWFLLDSAISLWLGATFNVWMINLVPLVLFGGLLLRARPTASEPRPAASTPSTAWSALRWACFGFAALGVVVALANHLAPFAVYRQGIADTWFAGALPAVALTWVRFSYALIGATFMGHFIMLGLALRHAVGQRWVLAAVATSMMAWFVVDAGLSAWHGAWFNLWLIDLPSFGLVMIPWALARAATPRPRM